MSNEDLQDLRSKLDDLDQDICEMLHFRMVISEEIHKHKKRVGLPIEDLGREEEVLEIVKKRCKNPILAEKIKPIFQMLMDSAKINGFIKTVHEFPYKKVGILGWGVMGGSFAKWIKAKNRNVKLLALDRPCMDLEHAKEAGYVEELCFTLEDLVEESDLIILATPLNSIISTAELISQAAKKRRNPLVVIDLGSVKKEITESFQKLTHPLVEFISTHPMAGSEKHGFSNSDGTLYYKAPWFIIPHSKNTQGNLEKVKSVISFFGSSAIEIDADTHDRKTALVSHFPGTISSRFLQFVKENDVESLEITGPGFKSFTRIGLSNPNLRKDIAEYNKVWLDYYFDKWLKFEKGSK